MKKRKKKKHQSEKYKEEAGYFEMEKFQNFIRQNMEIIEFCVKNEMKCVLIVK